MGPEASDAEKVPAVIEQFVRQLLVATKTANLYPIDSAIPLEAADETVRLLNEALERYAEVTLAITRQGLYFDEHQVFPGQNAFVAFAVELYHRRLAAVRFHAGVTARDILTFLETMKTPPEDLAAGGGFEAQLWDQGVGAITVGETQVSVVDAPAEELVQPADEPKPDATDETDYNRRRSTSATPRLRERIEIAHIIGDPSAAAEYLGASVDADGIELGLSGTARRFSEVARLSAEVDSAESENIVRSLAAAIWELEPDLRRDLLVERVLPEARVSDGLSEAVRRIGLDDVCRILTAGAGSGDDRRDGLSRAIRNLSRIFAMDRARFTEVAGEALRASGMDGSESDDLVARALPLRLEQHPTSALADKLDAPAAAVLKLIGTVPAVPRAAGDAAESGALAQEAELGISDGQVIDALVTVLTAEPRDVEFASTMSALEDQLGVLVVRGEIDVAADAALSLFDAAKNPALSPEQKKRLEHAVQRFARPEDMRAITQALWLFKPGEAAYEASARLLETLGPVAIPPILEQLAHEPDRTIRRALVDLLSRNGVRYIPEIGSHVSDGRWYFVRNVVAILGATHSPDVLPYLERSLRHSDARVRRETIRALSSVRDRRSMDLLGLALADEDAQNVQLAARYLGLRRVSAAVPALEAVARGESRGNRETGPRVEAIEALGRIGAPESLPVLRALARRRSLLGPGRHREIKAAAEAAIAAVKVSGEGEAAS